MRYSMNYFINHYQAHVIYTDLFKIKAQNTDCRYLKSMFWININKTYIPVYMLHVIDFYQMQESDCDLYLNIIYMC